MTYKKYRMLNYCKTNTFSPSPISIFKTLTFLAVLSWHFTSFCQNPLRQVLFTLEPDETIAHNEYFVESLFLENKFAVVIKNTQTLEHTFVFNGERIATTNYDYFDIPYLEPINENGYTISYYKEENGKENFYVNIKGITEGPFEDGCLFSEDGYAYKLNGKWYENIGGDARGPYIGSAPHTGNNAMITKSGKYAFMFYEDGSSYANINGNIFGPYEEIKSPVVTENGKYAFEYVKEGGYYLNVNGKISGPYNWYPSPVYTLNGKFAFAYSNSQGEFLNINGEVYGPYEKSWDNSEIAITDNGKFAFTYKENGKIYVNIYDKIFGPYQAAEYQTISELEKFAFCYKSRNKWYLNLNGKIVSHSAEYYTNVIITDKDEFAIEYKKGDQYYLDVNGNTHGPYDNTWDFELDENGNYSFCYEIKGLDFKYLYGKEILLREIPKTAKRLYMPKRTEKMSPDKKHVFLSDYQYEYVLIDGHKIGNSPALHVWYNDEKNAFIWNAVEGQELVVYEYKLNTK